MPFAIALLESTYLMLVVGVCVGSLVRSGILLRWSKRLIPRWVLSRVTCKEAKREGSFYSLPCWYPGISTGSSEITFALLFA